MTWILVLLALFGAWLLWVVLALRHATRAGAEVSRALAEPTLLEYHLRGRAPRLAGVGPMKRRIDEVRALGFRPVAWIEERVGVLRLPVLVMESEDQRTVAHVGLLTLLPLGMIRPTLSFQTLLEDGTLVHTATMGEPSGPGLVYQVGGTPEEKWRIHQVALTQQTVPAVVEAWDLAIHTRKGHAFLSRLASARELLTPPPTFRVVDGRAAAREAGLREPASVPFKLRRGLWILLAFVALYLGTEALGLPNLAQIAIVFAILFAVNRLS